MKRVVSFVLALVAIITIVPTVITAQDSPMSLVRNQFDPECTAANGFVEVTGPTTYYIVEGDNLYCLTPNQWRGLQAVNPKLSAAWRIGMTKKGNYRIHLTVNEPIEVPAGMTIRVPWTKPTEADTPVSIEDFVKPANIVAEKASLLDHPAVWFGLLALLLILIFLATIFTTQWLRGRSEAAQRLAGEERERELNQNPVTSGPPMVPGGIPATDAPRLSSFLDNQAVNRFVERHPHLDRSIIRPVRIGPIEEGVIRGEGLVGYLGQEPRPRRIPEPGLPGYRARYRFPDGTEEELMTLQACMNPVTYGGDTYRGFTFAPRATAVPTPEPERPAPQPAPHPAMAVARIRAAAGEEAASTILVGGKMVTIERGAHFDLDSIPGSVKITGGQFEMTVKQRQVKQTRRESRHLGTATGTDE